MKLKLNDYEEAINLYDKYQPYKGELELDDLVEILLNEMEEWRKDDLFSRLPRDLDTRTLIKALLTIRPSGNVSERMVKLVDSMLQEELSRKKITDSQSLLRIEGGYPTKEAISVWDGDIATLKIDAIVNAANHQMEGCFVPFHNCIDNVIHNASGIQLREDCASIMWIQGHEEVTADAKITRGYNLPSKYVIHTVGPIVSNRRISERDKEELEKTYEACLDLAKESGVVKSIAFCSISTGVYGFPFEPAARIALQTVASWMERNPGSIEHVVFNTFGKEATETYNRLLKEW